jgi:hypothetical protein
MRSLRRQRAVVSRPIGKIASRSDDNEVTIDDYFGLEFT